MTPEERELAGRLGRIAPRATPSADLDARILGAAHAAAGRKAGPARPRSRWPALVGIAATLALAVGVVWQLRPVHEVPVEREEMPSSAVIRSPATATATAAGTEAGAPVSESRLPRPAEPGAADTGTPAQSSEPRLRMLPPPAPRPAPPVVFDDPSPVDAPEVAALPAPPAAPPAPVPAPPPAPPAPPAPVMDTVAAAVNRPAAAAQARYQLASRSAAMQRKTTTATAEGGGADDAPAEPGDIDAPRRTITIADVPVDSDRMLDPVDWIERIRQRRDSGDLDSARASLDALREAHPALTLPDDVLAIATVSGTPPER